MLKFVRIVECLFSFSLYVSNILYKDSSTVAIYISRPFKVLSYPCHIGREMSTTV